MSCSMSHHRLRSSHSLFSNVDAASELKLYVVNIACRSCHSSAALLICYILYICSNVCLYPRTTRTSYILRIFSFLLLLCRTNKLSHWFHRNNFKWPLASVINIVLKVVIGENGRIIYLAFFFVGVVG